MAPEPHPQLELHFLRRQHLRSTALATLLAAIAILTLLGHNRLTDWDEGIYAQVSREMLQSGWLIPHWNSLVWIDKPPLTYWITALFFKLFGVSEFTARLGSALSAIAIVAVLHHWLLRARDHLTAWLSTIILLSTFGFLHVARVGETDTLLSLGSLLAVIGLSNLFQSALPSSDDRRASGYSKASTLGGWYLYWTGFAIALMSKSAASGTLFLTLLILLVLDPTLRHRVRAPFLYGFLLFLALILPWHLFMLHTYGQVFVRQYLGLHVLGRVAYQFDGHLTPWWYYLRVLLFSAPPWVLLYPIAIYAAIRPKNPVSSPGQPTSLGAPSSPPHLAAKVGSQDAYLRPFAVFALIQILFFSCVQTRLPHYMAPAYAPLSALVAIWLSGWLYAKSPVLATEQKTSVSLSHPHTAAILSEARSAQPKDPVTPRPSHTPAALYDHLPTPILLQFAAALTAIWILTALVTAHARSRLHSPALPNGQVTPNNREEIALLKQVFRHPSPLVASTPGPLLDLRPGTYNPIPTVVFYADRPVQQVALKPLPPNTPTDIYAFNPLPLAQTLPDAQPRLILIDRSLLPQIPANYTIQPIATSQTLEVGRLTRQP